MNIRDLTPSDFSFVEENKICQVPALRSCISARTVEDSHVIGVCLCEITTETTVILDKTTPRFQLVKALKMIEEDLVKSLPLKGVHNNHVFTEDERFANLLIKHFGYKKEIGFSLYREK